MFENKKILVTGGTGSFGRQIVKDLISYHPAEIRVFSRDEKKQSDMRLEFEDIAFLNFVIGDVRDERALGLAMYDIDIVFHAAALKQVPSCEYQVMEAVKTNILGAQNVIECSFKENVERVIAVSTDKACEPINAMGMTKALQERLFISANLKRSDAHRTIFTCVRYGNVLGSRGSVAPLFKKLIEEGKPLTVTDLTMTRFIITLPQSIELVFYAAKNGAGGEIFVRKMPGHTISDLADVFLEAYGRPKKDIIEIGMRPGEKIHETLISPAESLYTLEEKDYFVILPQVPIRELEEKYQSIKKKSLPGFTSQKMFRYSSENTQRLNKEELKELLKREKWL